MNAPTDFFDGNNPFKNAAKVLANQRNGDQRTFVNEVNGVSLSGCERRRESTFVVTSQLETAQLDCFTSDDSGIVGETGFSSNGGSNSIKVFDYNHQSLMYNTS